MTKLHPGDRIDCRIKSAAIVSPYTEYDEIRTFEIVAEDAHGYYLYVPHYLSLTGTVKADPYRCKHLGIDQKFVDENIVYVNTSCVARVVYVMDGMHCSNCDEYFAMAGPNQPDGKTLICYACKFNRFR
jgi:hypothetical protein